MKTFLDFIDEAEARQIQPTQSYTQFLASNGWKPFILPEDFTEPLITTRRKKKTIQNNFSYSKKDTKRKH